MTCTLWQLGLPTTDSLYGHAARCVVSQAPATRSAHRQQALAARPGDQSHPVLSRKGKYPYLVTQSWLFALQQTCRSGSMLLTGSSQLSSCLQGSAEQPRGMPGHSTQTELRHKQRKKTVQMHLPA